ncbi:MAG TPA: acyl-CoA dehydrogenase family protein [Kineosporiaceae bacterium]
MTVRDVDQPPAGPATPERRELRRAVRSLLDRSSPPAAVRAATESEAGFDRALWARLCGEIGVAGLAIPEEYGGAGAGWAELFIVMTELGRSLAPSPMLGSGVLAAHAVLRGADEAARRRLLPGIADGSRVAALVWTGELGGWDPEAVACRARPAPADGGHRPDGEAQHVLDGEAHYVLDGEVADVLLVAASTPSGVRLFEVDPSAPGVRRRTPPPMDLTRRLTVVSLQGAPATPLGTGCALAAVRDAGCLALAAEQVGAATRALELTVAHARTRHQFGRPIGSFQALAHRLADLHVRLAAARSALTAAASALDQGTGRDDLLAALVAISCTEALDRVTAETIQIHGGIGITWEHDAHLYFKRAHGSRELLGHPREQLRRLAVDVLDGEEPPTAW